MNLRAALRNFHKDEQRFYKNLSELNLREKNFLNRDWSAKERPLFLQEKYFIDKPLLVIDNRHTCYKVVSSDHSSSESLASIIADAILRAPYAVSLVARSVYNDFLISNFPNKNFKRIFIITPFINSNCRRIFINWIFNVHFHCIFSSTVSTSSPTDTSSTAELTGVPLLFSTATNSLEYRRKESNATLYNLPTPVNIFTRFAY